ncbi:conserved hypothetical protein [Flavobacterium sp. 9AF]|nr:conserved hypothetical protein [Flavobacterium sp. 9AF]
MFAQDPIALKLSEKEDLPDVEFYDIIEDNKGFIWLAADKGLYRFDGKRYLSYEHTDKRGLSVFGLKLDTKNQLWCNNISGQFFYIKENKLTLFLDLKNELKGELAEFFIIENKLFIFSTSVIFSVDLVTKKREKIDLTMLPKYPIIRAPFQSNNNIFFTANNSVCSVSKSNKVEVLNFKLKKYGNNVFPKFFKLQTKNYIVLYDNLTNINDFYLIKDNELIKTSFPEELQNVKIIKILNYQDNLWFCTSNGIILVNQKQQKLELKQEYFKKNFITNAILDTNQTLWVSTLTNGVFIVPSLQIKKYESIVSDEVISSSIKIKPNNLLLGTTKGHLFLLNLKTGNREEIKINSNRKIASLLFLSEYNTVLISIENDSYTYNLDNHKLKKNSNFNNAKNLHYIKDSNQIIYSGFDRASIYDFKNDAFLEYKQLNTSRAYASFFDKKNKEIYVSYVDNLIVYDSIFNPTVLKFKDRSITAKDIKQTSDGIVWIATFTDGVLGYKKNKIVKIINQKKGLKSNIIQKIESDEDDLWIVTDKGIQIYNSKKQKVNPNHINSSNLGKNIKDIIINKRNAFLISPQDIFEIEKDILFKKYYPKEISITSVSINEKDTLVQNTYDLPYDKNRIKFTFHTNGYFPDDELHFSYRLQGLSDEWIPIDSKVDFVSFTSLPSKSYVFEVRAQNSNQKQFFSKKILFQINLPYWKKWWFVLSIFLLLFGLIIIFYKNKLAIQEKEKELALKNAKFESELATLKLENLKSQMNPHFIFNALNSIQEYIILNQKQLASSYLAKFADLIRTYLEHSSKGYISIKEEMDCLSIYLELEKLRFEDKFCYHIENDNINEELKIPTMLIQPYVENAIKHGLLHKKTDRHLHICFSLFQNNEMIQCVIVDNGVGRQKAALLRDKKYTSFATKANQNRLELLNFGKEKKIGVTIEDLYNEYNKANGTRVTLLIPIIK